MHHIPTELPDKATDFSIEELFDAGAHFGHPASKTFPLMKPYFHSYLDGVAIFDLEKTVAQLKIAYNYAYHLGRENKKLLFVGTKRVARELVAAAAQSAKQPYMTTRWMGGMLTNWEQVRHSLQKMLKIERGLQTGAYQTYTKYEVVQLQKERDRLDRFFGGIRELEARPDALFVVDPAREKNAIHEAQISDIPVIALADSNANPNLFDLCIPANDDSAKTIQLVAQAVAAGYTAGRTGA